MSSAQAAFISGAYYRAHDEPTILLKLESAQAAEFLAGVFDELARGAPSIVLYPRAGISVETLTRLELRRVGEVKSKQIIRVSEGSFLWEATSEQWSDLMEWIEPFTQDQTGHQYLSFAADDDAEIEVSLHEGLAGLRGA